MKIFKLFLPLFMVFTLIGSFFQPIISNSESIAKKVFRLHIIASSDSTEDQNIKLLLRDHILEKSAGMFNESTLEDNIKIAKNNIALLTDDCNEYLKSIGSDDNVKLSVVKEFFDTRVYDDFTLPAGKYNSLKIEIGEGRGHNWWCIIFPSVCLSACSSSMKDYLNNDEMKLIEGGYSPKFKIIEIYEKIKEEIE